MASPFPTFMHNALLRFSVPSNTTVTDVYGIQRPGVSIVEVRAFLKQMEEKNRYTSIEPTPGVDTAQQKLEGYVTEVVGSASLILPSYITAETQCQATISGRNGQFFLDPQLPSAVGADSIVGSRLRGYFVLNDFTVDGDPGGETYDPLQPAGESIAARRLIVLIDGEYYLADATNLNHFNRVRGVTLTGVSTGNQFRPFVEGELQDGAWNWDVTKPLYVGSNGQFTQAVNYGTFAFIQQAATVIDATRIRLELQEAYRNG